MKTARSAGIRKSQADILSSGLKDGLSELAAAFANSRECPSPNVDTESIIRVIESGQRQLVRSMDQLSTSIIAALNKLTN